MAALSAKERCAVRLFARPFEWIVLRCLGEKVVGCLRRHRENGAFGLIWSYEHGSSCGECDATPCVHVLALRELFYGGHPMNAIVEPKGA
jgi:hypothetical protein